jgi:hypothetical protein
MKFNVVCKNLTISKDMKKDYLIKELYEISLQKIIYSENILLDPENSIQYDSPVDLSGIYNQNIFLDKYHDQKNLEKLTKKFELIIYLYMMFIYGATYIMLQLC